MSCNNPGPFDGGTWNQPTIVNGDIVSSTITGSTIVNPHIVDNVILDENAARSLAAFLCPHMATCFDPNAVAAVFTNCAGAPHTMNTAVPSCDEMNTAITDATTQLVSDMVYTEPSVQRADATAMLPTTIIGHHNDMLLGRPDAYIRLNGYLVPAYKAD